MKIYVSKKCITLIGKGSEIISKIKLYMNDFQTVQEWQQSNLTASNRYIDKTY